MARLSDTSSPTVYIQPDKAKSSDVLRAFAQGCGAKIGSTTDAALQPGMPIWYGIRPGWLHQFEQAKREGRDYLYVDNAFLDAGREEYFRVGVNAMQSWSREPSDGKRLDALGVTIKPWQQGRYVLLVPQSAEFMATMGGCPHWVPEMVTQIRAVTDRQIVIRTKGSTRPLAADLRDAWITVGHSTAALNESLLAGVPVVATAECAASEFATPIGQIESPNRPDERREWAARLADSQWSKSEMRAGIAWKAPHD